MLVDLLFNGWTSSVQTEAVNLAVDSLWLVLPTDIITLRVIISVEPSRLDGSQLSQFQILPSGALHTMISILACACDSSMSVVGDFHAVKSPCT